MENLAKGGTFRGQRTFLTISPKMIDLLRSIDRFYCQKLTFIDGKSTVSKI